MVNFLGNSDLVLGVRFLIGRMTQRTQNKKEIKWFEFGFERKPSWVHMNTENGKWKTGKGKKPSCKWVFFLFCWVDGKMERWKDGRVGGRPLVGCFMWSSLRVKLTEGNKNKNWEIVFFLFLGKWEFSLSIRFNIIRVIGSLIKGWFPDLCPGLLHTHPL